MYDLSNRVTEQQVTAAMSEMDDAMALRLARGSEFSHDDARWLASGLLRGQDHSSASVTQLRGYQMLLTERIKDVDLTQHSSIRIDAREGTPFMDSLAYELAVIVELPTFEHYVAELA